MDKTLVLVFKYWDYGNKKETMTARITKVKTNKLTSVSTHADQYESMLYCVTKKPLATFYKKIIVSRIEGVWDDPTIWYSWLKVGLKSYPPLFQSVLILLISITPIKFNKKEQKVCLNWRAWSCTVKKSILLRKYMFERQIWQIYWTWLQNRTTEAEIKNISTNWNY